MARLHPADRAVAVVAAVYPPVLLLLVDTHVISSVVGTDVSSILGAALLAYGGGQVVGKRKAAPRPDAGGA